MKYIEKHPMIMIVIGVIGISLSSIFVKYSTAPSAVTAAYRLLWTVMLMSPATWGRREVRQELIHVNRKTFLLCCLLHDYCLYRSDMGLPGILLFAEGKNFWKGYGSNCGYAFWQYSDRVF